MRILSNKCVSCHGHPPRADAPMSLTSWDELHAPTPTRRDAGVQVHEQMALRIHDQQHPMPPRDQAALSDDELSTLDIWFSAGAPSGQACDVSSQSDAAQGSRDAGQPEPTHAGSAGAEMPMRSTVKLKKDLVKRGHGSHVVVTKNVDQDPRGA